MKIFFQHILSMGIMVIALLFTVDSAFGQGRVYEETEYSLENPPLLASSLQTIADGEAPYLFRIIGEKIFSDKLNAPDNASDDQSENNNPGSEVTSGDAAISEGGNTEGVEVSSGNAEEITGGNSIGITAGNAGEGRMISDGNADITENGEATGGNAEQGISEEAVQNEQTTGDAVEVIEENVPDNYVLSSVTDDYFDDALFIGDSRTVGLSEYCPELNGRATFYSKVSLTIYGLDDKEFVSVPIVPEEGMEIPEDQLPREKVTVFEALSRKQFAKIYIMLGLNELGSGTGSSFTEAYSNVINQIRELQPDAIIIIQGIMHVTHSKSSKDRVFKNSTINERNEMLKALADGEHVFYVDMNEATDDANGGLTQDLSFDNVHLKAKSYALWYDYLKNHAYVRESQVEQYKPVAEAQEEAAPENTPE